MKMSKRNRKKPNLSNRHPLVDPTYLLEIVIPVHRNMELLEKCLDSIPEALNGIKTRLVIFDNATPNEERLQLYPKLEGKSVLSDKLKDAGIALNITKHGQNVGFPRACNSAAQGVRTPLLMFLNSDIVLQPNSLDYMVRDMDDPKIGVVGMKLLFPEEDMQGLRGDIRPAGKVQHVGLHTNVRSDFVHSYLGWSADHPKVNRVRDVYVVTGAALMTRRSLWNQIGGFFEGYGLGCYEDIDFGLSVRDLGYSIIVETKAVAYHYAGATAEKYQIGYPLQINKQILLSRWGNKLNWTEYLSW